MEKHVRRLLTVITEANLERSLIEDLRQLGARGYTITDARGQTVRTMTLDKTPGLRRTLWKLREDPAPPGPGAGAGHDCINTLFNQAIKGRGCTCYKPNANGCCCHNGHIR